MKFSGIIFITLGLLVAATGFAADKEWIGFDYREHGLSSAEFDRVKASGMSKSRLLYLLEIGVLPEEYFSEPWKKLGIGESEWISARKQGLEDGEVDRSLYTTSHFSMDPVVSFFLPGYYQYKTSRWILGGSLTTAALAGAVLTFVHTSTQDRGETLGPKEKVKIIYPIAAGVAMVWSAADAYLGTRFGDNPAAKKFSLRVGGGEEELALALSVGF